MKRHIIEPLQAELGGGALESKVRAEGVQSGDLLWVLQDAMQRDYESVVQYTQSSTVEQRSDTVAQLASGNIEEKTKSEQDSANPESQSSDQGTARDRDKGGAEQHKAIQLPDRPAWSLSEHYVRVREANPREEQCSALALHAALLEAGLQPDWTQVNPAAPPCDLAWAKANRNQQCWSDMGAMALTSF